VDFFLGEIRLFAGTFAPPGWYPCDGRELPIEGNDALYSLLGTMYGGNGQTTFALPDLRGRVPLHRSPTIPQGARAGTEFVTVSTNQIALHDHAFHGTTAKASQPSPANSVPAQSGEVQLWNERPPTLALNGAAIQPAQAGGQPHANMQPFQVLSYIISNIGIYPSRN
jgi:microcystin-dependent protein